MEKRKYFICKNGLFLRILQIMSLPQGVKCVVLYFFSFLSFVFFLTIFQRKKNWTTQLNYCMCIWDLLKTWWKWVMLSLLFVYFQHSYFLSQISKVLCQNIHYETCITNIHTPIKYFGHVSKSVQLYYFDIMESESQVGSSEVIL